MPNSNVIDAEIVSEEKTSKYDVLKDVVNDVAKGLDALGSDKPAAKIRQGVEFVEMTKQDFDTAKSALQRMYQRLENAGLIKISKRDWNESTKEKA